MMVAKSYAIKLSVHISIEHNIDYRITFNTNNEIPSYYYRFNI